MCQPLVFCHKYFIIEQQYKNRILPECPNWSKTVVLPQTNAVLCFFIVSGKFYLTLRSTVKSVWNNSQLNPENMFTMQISSLIFQICEARLCYGSSSDAGVGTNRTSCNQLVDLF